MDKFIVGLGGPPRHYEINGVKYIVSSSFQTARIKEHQGIVERFGKALKFNAVFSISRDLIFRDSV